MLKQKVSLDAVPRWKDCIKELPILARERLRIQKRKEIILRERSKLSWDKREAGFWLTTRGDLAFENIKAIYKIKYAKEQYRQHLDDLENNIDEWNDVISRFRSKYEESNNFSDLRNRVFRRDKRRCMECKEAKNLRVYPIVSLSELVTRFVKQNACKISAVNIQNIFFYDKNNAITMCYRCNGFEGDEELMQNTVNTREYIEFPCRQKEYFELGRLEQNTNRNLTNKKLSRSWFLNRLRKIKKLSCCLINSSYHDGGVSLNSIFGANLLLRLGKYDQAKRAVLRNERYFRQTLSERKIRELKIDRLSFAQRNWETIMMKTMDKLISKYRQGQYNIPYDPPYGQYSSKSFKALFRQAENEIRMEMGIPLIGEGWISETEVFYLVKDLLSEYKVIHHARPKWLERQEFDIYVPELKLAIEYMGEQHYRPCQFFGGKASFQNVKRLDAKKLVNATAMGIKMLYIKYDDKIDKERLRDRIKTRIG